MKTRTKFLAVTTLAVLCAGSSVAFAGFIFNEPVSITQNGSTIQVVGSLSSARFSSDSVQEIGCLTDNTGLTECSATDSTGKGVTCTSTSSSFASVARSITPGSNINFQFAVGGGTCKYLLVDNRSGNLH
jgi:hypothetical protein